MTYTFGNKDASIVLVQPVDEHDLGLLENEVKEIKRLVDKDFCLIAIKVNDWNADLSPWPMEAIFGNHDFKGGARKTLEEILNACLDKSKTYIIGGYSLAALFALWACYQTDVFTSVSAASPSMWYKGFIEYMSNNVPNVSNIYLSLGDKEDKACNKVMASVATKIREAHEILLKQAKNCLLEWNEGNHFKDSDLRTAKAFAWAINKID